MRLSDIAASISLREETVSRSLAKLRRAGYVERVGQGVLEVKDREGLRTFFARENSGTEEKTRK